MNAGAARRRASVLGLAVWLAASCGGHEAPPAVQAPPVLVAEVGTHAIEDRIAATGELVAPAQAGVAAQVDGQITQILFEEGAAVEQGAVVLEIDPERRELELSGRRAALVEAEAQAGESQREFARRKKLHDRGAASDATLDEVRTGLRLSRSRLDAARAQLGLAERALRDSSVVAPFSGFLARRYVSEGEFVVPGARLFDLVALDPIEVEFHLAERDSSRVEIGDPVAVSVAPFPDETFHASVTAISPTIDPLTRTLRVKARVENAEGRLRPGLFARVDLGISVREGVPMIPEDAVLQRADGPVAFRLVGDDRVERLNLRTGVHRDGLVEVVEGLAAGDRVVVRGQTELVDGAVVSLRDAEGRPARVGATASAGAVGASGP